MRFALRVAYFFYTFAVALVFRGVHSSLKLKGNRVQIPDSSRCCEFLISLRHHLSHWTKVWEGIANRNESEDLPSVYNEIMPAANGQSAT